MKTCWKAVLMMAFALFLNVNGYATDYPDGDYLRTCINCRADQDTLSCWCYADDQPPKYSKISHLGNCRAIDNHHGNLVCSKRVRMLPAGTYRNSCNDCKYNGRNLSCRCRDRKNTAYYPTTLMQVGRCHQDIANVNGRLHCVRGISHYSSVPKGSYLASCNRCTIDKRRILSCYCKRSDVPRYTLSKLFYPHRCLDVANISGRLTCITR